MQCWTQVHFAFLRYFERLRAFCVLRPNAQNNAKNNAKTIDFYSESEWKILGKKTNIIVRITH